MAVGTSLRMKMDIPNRYKFNPYFSEVDKTERKLIGRTLRHAIKIFLKKG